jgi:hypothetical protein
MQIVNYIDDVIDIDHEGAVIEKMRIEIPCLQYMKSRTGYLRLVPVVYVGESLARAEDPDAKRENNYGYQGYIK